MVNTKSSKGKEIVVSSSQRRSPLRVALKQSKRNPNVVVKRKEELKVVVKEESLSIKSKPSKLCDLIDVLNDAQKDAVREVGFGGLLFMSGWKYVMWSSTLWFIDHFDPFSRVLPFESGQNLVIRAADIEDLFKLPRPRNVLEGGFDVVSYSRTDENGAAVVDSFKTRLGLESTPTHKAVFNLLTDKRDVRFQNGGDDFKILFILYSLSTFLSPTANTTFDFHLLRSLCDVDNIRKLDWCSYVVNRLCKALESYKHKDKKSITGCILVIPLLYFHQFKWQGMSEPNTLPLIRHWTSQKFNNRLKAECSCGTGFGRGEWILGVFPLSEQIREPVTRQETSIRNEEDVCLASQDDAASDKLEVNEDDSASNKHEVNEDDADKQFITYKIPRGEKSDNLINAISKNDLHKSFMILQRDFNVIVSKHKERVEQFKRDVDIPAPAASFPISVLPDSDEYWNDDMVHKVVDDLVMNFRTVDKDKIMKNDYPKFDLDQNASQMQDPVDEVVVDDQHPDDQEKNIQKKNKKKKTGHVDYPSFDLLSQSSSPFSDSQFELPHIEAKSKQNEIEGQISSDQDKCEDLGKDDDQEVQFACPDVSVLEVIKKPRLHYKLEKTDEVPNLPVIDPMRWNSDSGWLSGKITFKTRFMKINDRYFKQMTRRERDIADFCFHQHRSVSMSNVFRHDLHGWKFYLSFHSIKSLNDHTFMDSLVIDAWSVILNKAIKFHCSKNPSAVTRNFYFNTQPSSDIESIFDSKDHDLIEEKAYSVRSYWHYSMKLMVQLNDLKTVDFFVIPICFRKHFVAVVINFDQSKIQYLDNILDNCLENSWNWKLVEIVKQQFSIFLKDMDHPRSSEVDSFPIEEVAFAWKSDVSNVDCGVFLMHHMENFAGHPYILEDLSNAVERRKLRVKYCSRIILSDINQCRDDILSEILHFAKRSK